MDFFEKVLQLDHFALASGFCDDEVEVFGFSDIDAHIIGVQQFVIALTDLRRRFQFMTFSADDVNVVEEGVVVGWSIRGVQIAKVWSKYPLSPPIASGFRGTALVAFDSFGKIVSMEFYWALT